MRVEDCFFLGQLRKPHGIHGELKAWFDVDYIEDYIEQESVYVLKDNKLTPVFFTHFRIIGPQLAIVAFRDHHGIDDAGRLSGLEMYLPLEELPDLEAGQFYYHEIVGFQVIDKALGELGKVTGVTEMPGQDLVRMDYKDQEVLIPLTDEIVPGVDLEAKVVHTDLPEGLLEIYM